MKDNGIYLDLRNAKDFQEIRLEIAYLMDEKWLKNLAIGRSSPEPLQEITKYHLSAQLKDPSILIDGISVIEIEEFPVSARVHIHDTINTNLPSYVRQMAEIEAAILADYNPRNTMKVIALQRRKAALKTRMGKEDLAGLLNELAVLLRPRKFINYCELQSSYDFYLECCEWGADLFRALGMMALPSSIDIISRTDLNIDNPATSAEMVYRKGKFVEDIQSVFKRKKRNKKY